MKFVLDASLTLAWCFADERTSLTDAVLRSLPKVGAAVPSLWVHEVANGLRSAQKHHRVAEQSVTAFVQRLVQLPIETIHLPAKRTLVEVRLLALAHNLSAYDASYLALAEGLGLPIGTLDGSGKRVGLKQAAAAIGVEIVNEATAARWLAAAE